MQILAGEGAYRMLAVRGPEHTLNTSGAAGGGRGGFALQSIRSRKHPWGGGKRGKRK